MMSWQLYETLLTPHLVSESQRSRHLCVFGGEKHTQMRQQECQEGQGSDQQNEDAEWGVSDVPTAWKVHVVHFQEEIVHQKPVTLTPRLNDQVVHTELQFVVLAAEEYETGHHEWFTLRDCLSFHHTWSEPVYDSLDFSGKGRPQLHSAPLKRTKS